VVRGSRRRLRIFPKGARSVGDSVWNSEYHQKFPARRVRSPEQPRHAQNIRSSHSLVMSRLSLVNQTQRPRLRDAFLLWGAYAPRVPSSAPPPKTSPSPTNQLVMSAFSVAGGRGPVSQTPRCARALFRNSRRPCLTSRCVPIAKLSGRRFPVFPEIQFRKADREVRHSDKR